MRLRDYIQYLGWGTRDLARHADINDRTAAKAIRGDVIRPWVAQRIAAALSTALETKVQPGDIEDLHIERK
jgi:hypothetical protein